MTLVVVKRVQDFLLIVSDTKLTDPTRCKWTPLDQSLKVVNIDSNWVVAFAGNTYFADVALKQFSGSPAFHTASEILLSAHKESRRNPDGETDFLLISVRTAAIHVFKGGICNRSTCNTTWIGDGLAFDRFQRSFVPTGNPKKGDVSNIVRFERGTRAIRPAIVNDAVHQICTRTSCAMADVIQDSSIPSVGGFPITLVIGHERAQLWPELSALFAKPNPDISPSAERDILFGEARTGDYNFEVIPAQIPSHNALAIYFRNANYCLLFRRWDGGISFARPIREVTSEKIEQRLARECNCAFWRINVRKETGGYGIGFDIPENAAPLVQKN
ncbi:hypothetical protein FLL57_17230 [Rhodopseudomonas palustris]|uniref:hypothetical protein n=1 Tax=Rhodopseudomonas palustris TaxID=1076 RepID=UPI00115CFB77|nr:hypothetical protein [Rhodopseudomonas palustris]QDL98944.1 hypothetical protein FLL57_17230 [Rhodopseudomonas palustris]